MSDWADQSRGKTPERVYGFLRDRAPDPVCDDCIAKGTGASRETVNPLTHTLGLTRDFDKVRGRCSMCHGAKLVTRSLQQA
jgi:hypothetical protein